MSLANGNLAIMGRGRGQGLLLDALADRLGRLLVATRGQPCKHPVQNDLVEHILGRERREKLQLNLMTVQRAGPREADGHLAAAQHHRCRCQAVRSGSLACLGPTTAAIWGLHHLFHKDSPFKRTDRIMWCPPATQWHYMLWSLRSGPVKWGALCSITASPVDTDRASSPSRATPAISLSATCTSSGSPTPAAASKTCCGPTARTAATLFIDGPSPSGDLIAPPSPTTRQAQAGDRPHLTSPDLGIITVDSAPTVALDVRIIGNGQPISRPFQEE